MWRRITAEARIVNPKFISVTEEDGIASEENPRGFRSEGLGCCLPRYGTYPAFFWAAATLASVISVTCLAAFDIVS